VIKVSQSRQIFISIGDGLASRSDLHDQADGKNFAGEQCLDKARVVRDDARSNPPQRDDKISDICRSRARRGDRSASSLLRDDK
jgi:hypothetical protein